MPWIMVRAKIHNVFSFSDHFLISRNSIFDVGFLFYSPSSCVRLWKYIYFKFVLSLHCRYLYRRRLEIYVNMSCSYTYQNTYIPIYTSIYIPNLYRVFSLHLRVKNATSKTFVSTERKTLRFGECCAFGGGIQRSKKRSTTTRRPTNELSKQDKFKTKIERKVQLHLFHSLVRIETAKLFPKKKWSNLCAP